MDPRTLGVASIAGSILGLLYAPFHGAAYLATQSESPPLLAWDSGFRDAFPWAFDFASPHGVYVTYGRILPLVLAGLLAGLWALHALQRSEAGAFERRTFWPLFTVHSILAASTVVEYYTSLLDEAFLVAGPALLLSLIGYIVYGVATIKAKIVPQRLGWGLIAGAAVVVPLIAAFGHLPIALSGLYVAWIANGLFIARSDVRAPEAMPKPSGPS